MYIPAPSPLCGEHYPPAIMNNQVANHVHMPGTYFTAGWTGDPFLPVSKAGHELTTPVGYQLHALPTELSRHHKRWLSYHVVTLYGCSPHPNLRWIWHWPFYALFNFQTSSMSSCLLNAITLQELPVSFRNFTRIFSTSKSQTDSM